ncbi:MAG: peptidase M48 [Halobacteriovoraceae bacterium]|nr:peptidase M48 [Halobacteriovoraceae bacterium]|tara:strand:- start:2002 stop:3246 length:1245 start_codon:yes stop_codon:yes gene_type:complete
MILTSFIILFILTVATKLTLIALNIKSVQENVNVPQEFAAAVDQNQHEKAQRYTIKKAKFSLLNITLSQIILLIWLFSGALDSLASMSAINGISKLSAGVVFLILFNLINGVINLPLTWYYHFGIEQEFGFNKMTPALFLKDNLKQLLLGLLIGVPLLYAILYFIYETDTLWWLYAWSFLVVFQFLMVWAYPKFIAPLFNKFEPLKNEDLTLEINKLLQTSGMKFKDFFTMNASIRSSHGNAYFTGFGKNKRIVFFDTLLKTLEKNEVIAVLAHELGHLKKKHILKSIVLGMLSMLIGFYILSLAVEHKVFLSAFNINTDEKYMQLLLFTLITPYYTFFLTPISSWFSRKNEFEADEFAATYTRAEDLVSALLKLIRDNSSSLTPHPLYSKFYFSHPPPKERIAFLKQLQIKSS